jgi:protein TonB
MTRSNKARPVVFTVTVRFDLDDEKKPQVSVSGGGAVGGVEGGVEGGVVGGVKGGVEGGVVGGVLGGVEAGKALKEFEGDAVRALGEVKQPKPVKSVKPVYPKIARQARVEGVVILEAVTDEQGYVVGVRVLRSIPLLDQAAMTQTVEAADGR